MKDDEDNNNERGKNGATWSQQENGKNQIDDSLG